MADIAGVVIHGVVAFEILEVNEFEASVVGFDDCGKRLYPIARVEIVNVAHRLVGRSMDMSADDADAVFGDGELGELFFEAGYEIDRLFDLRFDRFAKRVVFFAPPGPVFIVPTVQ